MFSFVYLGQQTYRPKGMDDATRGAVRAPWDMSAGRGMTPGYNMNPYAGYYGYSDQMMGAMCRPPCFLSALPCGVFTPWFLGSSVLDQQYGYGFPGAAAGGASSGGKSKRYDDDAKDSGDKPKELEKDTKEVKKDDRSL